MIAKNKEHRILWLPGEARMWDEDGDSRSSSGVRIDSNNAHQVAAVFACLRVIAETVASLPLHVLERTPGGGKRVARELPLYRQLHSQPNGWQTSFEWREQAVFHIGLWGNAFSELKAGQIVPLHPSRMKVERIENGKIRYKFREDKGTETVYSNEQILQIRGPSDDGINGMSIVEECKDAIALARACELHGARFFAAGARPGFVLSTDGNLNAEAREALRSQWDRRHGGVGNSHNTAVLTGGLKPYEIPQSSNSDAQFLELRRYQLDEIARLFRVPGHLLGSGAGSAQADIEFVQHTILPWLRRFESAFMRDLIEDDDRYLIEFDVRGLLRGDSSSRSAYYRAMWDIGVLNTDDIRELENMDPVEGGDVRYRPLNMGTLGEKPTEGDVLAQQQPGSGIDGQAVEGGLAAAAGEPVVPATPGESAETSLTTAEVSSLLTVVKQITDGLLSVDAARAIIAAAFPVLSAARVETILQGVAVKQEEPAQAPVPPAAAAPAARSQPVESRAMTISIDFDRTFAADPTMWGEFARKAVSEGNTVVMISRRPEEDRQTVTDALGDYAEAFSQVLLVGGDTLKADAAQAAGIDVDVWVDDSPQTITPAKPCDECEDKPRSRSRRK
jgi:HK97 family phage portal protein